MLYFAYGSNMSIERLTERVPSVAPVETGRLYRHTLLFHKVGIDGSGKCNAYDTGYLADCMQGVLYEIDATGKRQLDAVEGSCCGYHVKDVTIQTHSNRQVQAFTSCAYHIGEEMKPFHWYKYHVLTGAEEHNLDPDYIEQIRCIESVADPDRNRSDAQLCI